ncbi:MAG: FG-GAP repeat protein, partial [Phycisphaerales bacterium]|nr:FG-GAP repeat protein [Phycisphaerales bacterium]
GVPDDCDILAGDEEDCDADGVPDSCSLAYGVAREIRKLTGSTTDEDDGFGSALAIDGDMMVIGARSDEVIPNSGSAFVFRNNNGNWEEVTKLTADVPTALDIFGDKVAIQDGVIAISASGDDDLGSGSGSVFVFREVDGAWERVAKLQAMDGSFQDNLGSDIDMDGVTIIAGAPNEDAGGNDAGAAYVFREVNGTWEEVAKLGADDAEAGNRFGASVAIEGNIAVVGAYRASAGAQYSGCAYVFRESGGVWSQVAKITPPNPVRTGWFGSCVAIDSGVIAIGSPNDVSNGVVSGSLFVYQEEGGTWSQIARLTPIQYGLGGHVGRNVSMAAGCIAAGAYDSKIGGENRGATYLFREDGPGQWRQVATIMASDGEAGDHFGFDVAIDDGRLLVGATFDDDDGDAAGAAYVLDVRRLSTDCNSNLLIDVCETLRSIEDFVAAVINGSNDPQAVCLYDSDHNGLLDGRDIQDFLSGAFANAGCDTSDATIDGFVAALLSGTPSSTEICLYDADDNDHLDALDIAAFVDRLLNP